MEKILGSLIRPPTKKELMELKFESCCEQYSFNIQLTPSRTHDVEYYCTICGRSKRLLKEEFR